MDLLVNGIDISHWQGTFDFAKASAEGNKFCFVKATDGSQYIDGQFRRNWSAGREHGLLVGAYHFFRPDEDAERQANHFLETVGPLPIGTLPCVLDWEVTGHVRNSQQVAGAQTWLRLVHEKTGVMPIIYTGPAFLKALGDMKAFAAYPLWIAHYGVKRPLVSRPWVRYTFWQYSSKGGIDRNLFNGTLQELRALAGIS